MGIDLFLPAQTCIFRPMKNTPFTDIHIALGAKMAEFAGYNMPISYTGINEEHQCVRTNAGVFDVSHMGEFIVKGEHALDLIQRVTTNDAAKLTDGKAQYSCMPNNEGGLVDDLLVYCVEENKTYMLVVNASNIKTGTGSANIIPKVQRCTTYLRKQRYWQYKALRQYNTCSSSLIWIWST